MNISHAVAAITLALLSTVSSVCSAQADQYMNAAAAALFNQAQVLLSQGKMQEALAKYSDAAKACLLYTSPSPRDATLSRMPSSA